MEDDYGYDVCDAISGDVNVADFFFDNVGHEDFLADEAVGQEDLGDWFVENDYQTYLDTLDAWRDIAFVRPFISCMFLSPITVYVRCRHLQES